MKNIIQVKVIRHKPDWDTMALKYQDILMRLLYASSGKLSINIDTEFISEDFPITSADYPQGRAGIDLKWYDKVITPRKGKYHIVCVLVDKVVNNGNTFGWHIAGQKNQVFAQENETISSNSFGTINVFVQSFLHELCHSLKEMDGLPDRTHEFLDNAKLPAGIFDLSGLLNTCDYNKISNFLNK